jgi:hypothetical protein
MLILWTDRDAGVDAWIAELAGVVAQQRLADAGDAPLARAAVGILTALRADARVDWTTELI